MKNNLPINPPKCYWLKKEGVSQNGQIPNIIGICSYCVQDRSVFNWNQVLLHPELTLWWSFLFAEGAHHKKPPPTPGVFCGFSMNEKVSEKFKIPRAINIFQYLLKHYSYHSAKFMQNIWAAAIKLNQP